MFKVKKLELPLSHSSKAFRVFVCRGLPFLFLFFFSVSLLAQQQYRTWTSKTGVKMQAIMIGVDGDKVIIQQTDKKSFIFPLSLLFPFDQAYVRIMRPRFSQPKSPSLLPDSLKGSVSVMSLPFWGPESKDD
jgi:hypothetical protein